MSESRRMSIDPCLSSYSKVLSKWIKALNTKTKSLNWKGEKLKNSFEHIVTGDFFLNRTLIAQTLRLNNQKLRSHYSKTLFVRQRTLSIEKMAA